MKWETAPKETEYNFMRIGVRDEAGKIAHEKFFIGRLPLPGEAVEMVFTDVDDNTGEMKFQLRVKA